MSTITKVKSSATRRLVTGILAAVPVLALGVVAGMPSAQAATQSLSYTIHKDGDPIGKEIYTINHDGDKTTVNLTADSQVQVLFLNFHYHHQRTETWTGSHLDRMVADTDDDGTKHHVEAQTVADGVKVVADGRDTTLPADALPLTMWTRAVVVEHSVLYSVENDDSPYKVSIRDLGTETVKTGQGAVAAEHYAIAGDVERDLWFGSDGTLVEAAFHRRGFLITIVRD